MSYIARRPAGRLRGIVDRLWLVEDAGPSSAAETICPDGRTEIVLHIADPMCERVGDRARVQPRHLLVGQMADPMTVVPTGRIAMVGARLTPCALHRLVGIPQQRLAGQVHDLEAVWSTWTRRAVEEVGGVDDPAARLAAFERALESLIPSDLLEQADRSMDAAAARLLASGGRAPIDRLAQQTGISRRQFERRFLEQVGRSPRLFGRIVRFQRAFQMLGTESGAFIAARCGYADQAHLVREIRRFSGQTPTLLGDASGLTAFFRVEGVAEISPSA